MISWGLNLAISVQDRENYLGHEPREGCSTKVSMGMRKRRERTTVSLPELLL